MRSETINSTAVWAIGHSFYLPIQWCSRRREQVGTAGDAPRAH